MAYSASKSAEKSITEANIFFILKLLSKDDPFQYKPCTNI